MAVRVAYRDQPDADDPRIRPGGRHIRRRGGALHPFHVAIPYGVSGGALSLLISLVLFFAISFASQPPSLDPDVAAIMDL